MICFTRAKLTNGWEIGQIIPSLVSTQAPTSLNPKLGISIMLQSVRKDQIFPGHLLHTLNCLIFEPLLNELALGWLQP